MEVTTWKARSERKLTLVQLEALTGISKTCLLYTSCWLTISRIWI